jgi:carbamoyl-phosphate synthase large subunit
MAFAKSQSAAKNSLPSEGKVFISLCDLDKEFAPSIAKGLTDNGFTVVATGGTHKIISDAGIECEKVLKISEGRPNITDLLTNGDIAMAINTSEAKENSKEDGKNIRRTVLKENVPYFTTVAAANAAVEAIKVLKTEDVSTPKSIQEFLEN